jgi:hypothetical protein
VNAPLLSLEGAVKLNGTSLKFFEGIENDVIVGAIGDTTREAVTVDPPVELPSALAAWVAVIVVDPAPTMDTVPPVVTVATPVLLLL